MSNKKKIVIVISIISILILCFSISSFAYGVGDTISSGTEITFNEELVFPASYTSITGISYTSNNISFNNMILNSDTLQYKSAGSQVNAYITVTGWQDNNYMTIKLNSDYTISNQNFADFLNNNSPQPPHLEPSFWETVSGFFSEALASGTAIVNWMTATPIALIPLALYCLIVIIAITKRMIKG